MKSEFDGKMKLILAEKSRNEELQTLNRGFQVANVFINKEYLDSFSSAGILPGSAEDITSTRKIRFFKMTKVVLDPKEDTADKLTSVYSALYNLTVTTAIILHGTKGGVDFYYACRSDAAAPLAGQIMESNLRGNFPGIELSECFGEEKDVLLSQIGKSTDGSNMLGGLASVSLIPSIRDKEKKEQFVQGLEKLLNVMQGRDFLGVLLAEPMDTTAIANRRHGLEEFYSTMTPHAKFSYSFGENKSHTVSKGISTSFSKSVNESVSNSNSTSRSSSQGTSSGTSSGSNFGGGSSGDGSSSSWGFNSGSSSSTTQSYTSGTSFSHSISKSEGTSETEGENSSDSDTEGTSLNKTINYENKGISDLLQKIEQQLARLNSKEAYGMWEAAAYFFSDEISSAVLAASAYKAIMSGEQSGIEQAHVNIWRSSALQDKNIRLIYDHVTHLKHPKAQIVLTDEYQRQYVTPTTLVSSNELGILFGLPRKSVAGVAVQEMAEFGRSVVYENRPPKRSMSFGNIYHMGQVQDVSVEMDVDLFSSHCFITGSSGSGKSYATYNLLDRLLSNGVKMMVVEPAKGEYKQVFGNLDRVRIYTTDSVTYQLLRINPFQFPEKIHVLSHIEQLMQIFTASWPLYAAMPAILKQSVVNAYIRCGWDIQNSIWIPDMCDHKYPVFQDVLSTLPEIINTSDYSADSKGDYKGALLTRVEAMTTGMNGMLFQKSLGIPDEILFDENVLIDLSEVGSGETIALIMGVLIMRLNEYRKSQRKLGIVSTHDSGLQHVTVLEEAHNLLKRTSKEQGADGGNMIGKSVEMISNSIKEMRTYGEGFLIIDQSPLAVDSSAIENTATKIIMNTPSKDACQELGSALSLNEEQTRELSRLNVGVAAVMQKGWMSPVLMKVGLWNPKKYEAPMQFENAGMMRFVRSLLMREFIHQIRQEKFNAVPLTKIIRDSKLHPDRKQELSDIPMHVREIKRNPRQLTSKRLGEILCEIAGCRAMLNAVSMDGIISMHAMVNEMERFEDKDNDKMGDVYRNQLALHDQWIRSVMKALNLYIDITNTEKWIMILFVLQLLDTDPKHEDTAYGNIFMSMSQGAIPIIEDDSTDDESSSDL